MSLARTAVALEAYDAEYARYLEVVSHSASNSVLDYALKLLHAAERAVGEAYAKDTAGETSYSSALLVGASPFIRQQVREWRESGKP